MLSSPIGGETQDEGLEVTVLGPGFPTGKLSTVLRLGLVEGLKYSSFLLHAAGAKRC